MPRSSTKTASDTDNSGISATDDIDALRAELAELRAGKAHAEGEAQTERQARRAAEHQNMTAQERAVVADQEACDSRLAVLEGEAQAIEDQIAVLADEPGHGREVAQLTRKLTTIGASLTDEGRRKEYLAGQREKVTAKNKETREAAPADDGRKLANGIVLSKLGTKTQAFLEMHPKAFTDVRYAKLAVMAAQKAVDIEGLKDESPEYFAFIEGELGGGTAPAETEEVDGEEIGTGESETRESYVPEKPQHRAAGPGALAAAPTRQIPTGSGNGGNRRSPTLNAQEREAALNIYSHLNISDADKLVRYAAGKKYMAEKQNKHFVSN